MAFFYPSYFFPWSRNYQNWGQETILEYLAHHDHTQGEYDREWKEPEEIPDQEVMVTQNQTRYRSYEMYRAEVGDYLGSLSDTELLHHHPGHDETDKNYARK